VAAVCTGALPAAADELIDGGYGLNPEPDGKSPFAVLGWAVARCDGADGETLEVALRVDGEVFLRGRPFMTYPGVAERFPDVPGADRAGFRAQIDPAALTAGEHRLEIVVMACGTEKVLGVDRFESAPPTPALIAVPFLLLVLAVLGGLGWLLGRRPTRFWTIARLPTIVAIVSIGLVVVVVAARHIGGSVIEVDDAFFASLANWDGGFYLDISAGGYPDDVPVYRAYFPLYPLLLAVLSVLPGPLPLLAALVNVGLFVTAILFLRRLYPEQDNAILFFAVLPFAFFHVAVYTEALALVLALAYLHSLRARDLGRVVLFGLLAGLTRITGVALIFFAIEPLRRKEWRAAAAAVAGPAGGMAAWMAYLGVTTGDPLAFLHTMTEFDRVVTFNPGRLLDLLASLPERGGFVWWELVFAAVVLAGSAALAGHRRYGEALYSTALVLMPLYTIRLTSVNRYALAAFPVFLLLGGVLAGRISKRAYYALIAAEIALLLYYAARFGQQYWVG
jgi:hypothetical protein